MFQPVLFLYWALITGLLVFEVDWGLVTSPINPDWITPERSRAILVLIMPAGMALILYLYESFMIVGTILGWIVHGLGWVWDELWTRWGF